MTAEELNRIVNKPVAASQAIKHKKDPIVAVKTIESAHSTTVLWNRSKKIGNNAVIGQIIMAKMRSYRPWPAIVRENQSKTVLLAFAQKDPLI